MKRRAFLVSAVTSASGLLLPGLSAAQPARPDSKVVRMGILRAGVPAMLSGGPITTTLSKLGWVEGKNIVFDRVYADRDETRLPALAAELVARKVDLIHTMSNPEALAAAGQTKTIPIVFGAVVDPVENGLVKSLARPGGNLTGVATIGPETGRKRMEILKEALPKTSRVGLLMRPPSISPTSARELRLIEESAGPGVKVVAAMATDRRELDAAFSLLTEQRVQALLLAQVAFFSGERKRIVGLAAKHGIPVIAHRSEFTDDGALMSYNASLQDQLRRSLHLADKILRGAKPAEIPVEQPTKFELVVNLKAARALGITIPQSILLRADRVIE